MVLEPGPERERETREGANPGMEAEVGSPGAPATSDVIEVACVLGGVPGALGTVWV